MANAASKTPLQIADDLRKEAVAMAAELEARQVAYAAKQEALRAAEQVELAARIGAAWTSAQTLIAPITEAFEAGSLAEALTAVQALSVPLVELLGMLGEATGTKVARSSVGTGSGRGGPFRPYVLQYMQMHASDAVFSAGFGTGIAKAILADLHQGSGSSGATQVALNALIRDGYATLVSSGPDRWQITAKGMAAQIIDGKIVDGPVPAAV